MCRGTVIDWRSHLTVFSAAFSPDGKRMVTTAQALVSQAKADVPRCLTPAQREAFFLPPEPPGWCVDMEKWPYNTPKWKQLLVDKRAGEPAASL